MSGLWLCWFHGRESRSNIILSLILCLHFDIYSLLSVNQREVCSSFGISVLLSPPSSRGRPGALEVFAMASDWVDFFRGMKNPVAAVVVFLSFIQKHELEWEIPYSIARVSFNSLLLASFNNLSFTNKKYSLSRCNTRHNHTWCYIQVLLGILSGVRITEFLTCSSWSFEY